jgi:hypothetical protein
MAIKRLSDNPLELPFVMLNPERVILNLVQNLQGRLVSASNKINMFRNPEIVDPESSSGPGSG